MNFLEALTKANQLMEAINALAAFMKANTEATDKHTEAMNKLIAEVGEMKAQNEKV